MEKERHRIEILEQIAFHLRNAEIEPDEQLRKLILDLEDNEDLWQLPPVWWIADVFAKDGEAASSDSSICVQYRLFQGFGWCEINFPPVQAAYLLLQLSDLLSKEEYREALAAAQKHVDEDKRWDDSIRKFSK